MADLDLGGSLYLILIEEGTQTGPHCLAGERQFLEAQALLILEVPTLGEKAKAASTATRSVRNRRR